jgi:hypothetical protein
MRLLTESHANAKTAKNASQGRYLSYILHLAPSRLSGYNVCPKASSGCIAACLNTAGRGVFSTVQAARIRKTKYLIESRKAFLSDLIKDLDTVERKAAKLKYKPVVRLNGTSDLNWLTLKTDNGLSVIDRYPRIQFYDYTKVLVRLKGVQPPNYHLTFSLSETNVDEARIALARGFNVAVVFKGPIPARYLGTLTLDGDSHDLRFLDKHSFSGRIVALKAKGRAKRDASGFVVQCG